MKHIWSSLLQTVSENRKVRDVSFFLFLAGLLAYGAYFSWYMLDRFDFVDMTRWPGNMDDSFYYFQIARNLAEGTFSSFDGGITRTNGYHPLWMLLITPFYWPFDSESALLAIKAFEIMLIAGGVALVVLAARICGQPWILLIAVLPSLYSPIRHVARDGDGDRAPAGRRWLRLAAFGAGSGGARKGSAGHPGAHRRTVTTAMPRPKLGLWTVTVLCAGLLAVGIIAENLVPSPSKTTIGRLSKTAIELWRSPSKTTIELSPSRFPSTLAVPPDELDRPGSVLSVYTEERYLRDPDYGLLNHREQHGRNWEHPAVMSYFEDGALQFASPVGLRVHGGWNRTRWKGLIDIRLYFRRDYNSAEFRPSTIFDGRRNPITRLVVRNAWQHPKRPVWYLTNELAYDIARQVGALAPDTHPVSFVLNGNPMGLYVLTEPVRRTFLESRFGHSNFERAKLPDPQRPSQPDEFELPDPWQRQPFTEALEELKSRGGRLTLADASHWIDVESLTRWFVSIVFCATTDPFQAAILRDRTHPDSLWFWVNWDMDHSFKNVFNPAPVAWLHDTFRATLESNQPWERNKLIESYLIGRLLAEDPAYRDYLAREFLDALNYRLTPAFLDERYRYYRAIAEQFGLGDEPYLEILANFLEFRSAHVREQLVRELDLAPLRQVRIEGPQETAFRIDGHAVAPGFSGWYVPGTDIHVEVDGQPANFSHWMVAGRRVPSPELRQQVEENIVIEAKFRTQGEHG